MIYESASLKGLFNHFFIYANPKKGRRKLVIGIEGTHLTLDWDDPRFGTNLHETKGVPREHVPLVDILLLVL